MKFWHWYVCIGCVWASVNVELNASEPIDFNRDVRSILSDKCYRCHGPDEGERATDLRLDQQEIATAELDSGTIAVVPRNIAASELARRIRSTDADESMPPASSGKKLTPSEIETLEKWIEQGAPWDEHWAFVRPVRAKIARERYSQHQPWVRNSIDTFVAAQLQHRGQSPSQAATKTELIRRVTLDLTGVNPTADEVLQFLRDDKPDAYERVVDRLLHSVRFGEHQARHWLDVARYGDTHGLHLDNERSIWPYRDWVISTLNANMPFDEFTILQLAGDLLPMPTQDQLVATGFHRCNVTTGEGGSIDEEYLVRYATERAETTSTVWMGLTTGCAACHDHKFDPITQQEFYQLYAYFFSLTEKAMDGNALLPPPFIKVKTNVHQRKEKSLQARIADVDEMLTSIRKQAKDSFDDWVRQSKQQSEPSPTLSGLIVDASFDSENDTVDLGDQAGVIVGNASWDAGKVGSAFRFDGKTHIENKDLANFERTDRFSFGGWIYRESDQHLTALSRMDDGNQFRGYDLYVAKGKVFVHLVHRWPENAIRINTRRPIIKQKWQHVMATYDGSNQASGIKIYFDGELQDVEVTHDRLTDSIRTKTAFHIGRRNPGAPFIGMLDEVKVFARELSSDEVLATMGADPIAQLLSIPRVERTAKQNARLFEYCLNQHDEQYRAANLEKNELKKRLDQMQSSAPSSLVMKELQSPRQAYLLNRGQYDQKKKR